MAAQEVVKCFHGDRGVVIFAVLELPVVAAAQCGTDHTFAIRLFHDVLHDINDDFAVIIAPFLRGITGPEGNFERVFLFFRGIAEKFEVDIVAQRPQPLFILPQLIPVFSCPAEVRFVETQLYNQVRLRIAAENVVKIIVDDGKIVFVFALHDLIAFQIMADGDGNHQKRDPGIGKILDAEHSFIPLRPLVLIHHRERRFAIEQKPDIAVGIFAHSTGGMLPFGENGIDLFAGVVGRAGVDFRNFADFLIRVEMQIADGDLCRVADDEDDRVIFGSRGGFDAVNALFPLAGGGVDQISFRFVGGRTGCYHIGGLIFAPCQPEKEDRPALTAGALIFTAEKPAPFAGQAHRSFHTDLQNAVSVCFGDLKYSIAEAFHAAAGVFVADDLPAGSILRQRNDLRCRSTQRRTNSGENGKNCPCQYFFHNVS